METDERLTRLKCAGIIAVIWLTVWSALMVAAGVGIVLKYAVK